jgi:hypothetical protein
MDPSILLKDFLALQQDFTARIQANNQLLGAQTAAIRRLTEQVATLAIRLDKVQTLPPSKSIPPTDRPAVPAAERAAAQQSNALGAQVPAPPADPGKNPCANDRAKLCVGVVLGEGRMLACMVKQKEKLSTECTQLLISRGDLK